MPLDIHAYYAKLASGQTLTEDDAVVLLKELAATRTTAAYLADCHAATLETLPKSASMSNRKRHISICEIAAKALRGDLSGIKYPATRSEGEHVAERCEKAVLAAQAIATTQRK